MEIIVVAIAPPLQRDLTRRTGVPRDDARRIRDAIAATDAVIVVATLVIAQGMRFGVTGGTTWIADMSIGYFSVSAAVAVLWLAFLAGFRTRSSALLGAGDEEYRRVVVSALALFITIAVTGFVLQIDVARGYLAYALPLGTVALLLGRWAWRLRIARLRSAGVLMHRVLVAGDTPDVEYVAEKIQAAPTAGYSVAAVATSGLGRITDAARAAAVDAVVIAGAIPGGHERLRELGWELQSCGIDLVVSSPLVDVASSRIQRRPVDGLPLLHINAPDHGDRIRLGKRLFDVLAAGVGLLLLIPFLAAIALMIRLDSEGPVLFRQARVGRNGTTFHIVKFRTMCLDAEAQVDTLLQLNEGSGPLFKLKADPRITRVGHVLRKLSLDELPQLINVVRGEMSLVGPRPALPREVSIYEEHAQRRLLVRPGITGLWQISGRSDLDWAVGLRLDLHYVDNWSFTRDLVILARTIPSVLRSRGAY